MTFLADIQHWSTIDAFERTLARQTPPVWARGVTLHHTYRPLPSDWRGERSMRALQTYYARKGWRSGPHLFIVSGAPDPAHDGIWQLTPLSAQGVHAGRCNATHIGVEVVGDYDEKPWTPILETLVICVAVALLRWLGASAATPDTLNGHRECLPNKTCPGAAIDMNAVRRTAGKLLASQTRAPIFADAAIIAPPRCTLEQAIAAFRRRPSPHYTQADIETVIIPAYFAVCAIGGVDPCIALAQMAHETGWLSSFWSARPQRNPAGIGVTGEWRHDAPPDLAGWAFNTQRNRWERGVSFPTWAEHAVPAHVGRLIAYATRLDQRTPAQRHLVDAAMRARALPVHLHGSAPRLCDLDGRWAVPGAGYGARIAAIATRIRDGTNEA